MMTGLPTGAHVWIVAGVTDLRRGGGIGRHRQCAGAGCVL